MDAEFTSAKTACKNDANDNFMKKLTKNKRKMCDKEERRAAQTRGEQQQQSPYCIGVSDSFFF